MKKLIIFISIILLCFCTNKSKNSISLFNNISFQIQNGEENTEIQQNISMLYTEYFNNQQTQIPLFKFIKHSNYKIFIGIPYDTSIEKMIKTKLEENDSCRISFESNSKSYFAKYNRDRFYISEYATIFDNGTIIFISTLTNMKEISDSLFNKSKISTRIKLKN
jgi:hypothetical protein